jgi:hypothetical protein
MFTPGDSGSGAGPSSTAGGGRLSRAQTPSSMPREPTPSDMLAPTTATDGQGTENENNVIEIEDDVQVGRKRKLKSDVWNDFDPVTIGGIAKARCKWCTKTLSVVGRNGTSHLRSHLNSCDSRNARKGLKQSTLKLSATQDGSVLVEKYVFDQGVARKELALMICVHEYPLSIVDHVGFRRFYAALQPLFKVVSRNAIRKDILDMYLVQKVSMVKQFLQQQSRIAVTTDMWTANHQKKGYMAVTVHYVDESWNLKSYLLR